jgi:hypothetical protein
MPSSTGRYLPGIRASVHLKIIDINWISNTGIKDFIFPE